jgi:hypothetical protein
MASKKKPAARAASPVQPGKPAPADRRAVPPPKSKSKPAPSTAEIRKPAPPTAEILKGGQQATRPAATRRRPASPIAPKSITPKPGAARADEAASRPAEPRPAPPRKPTPPASGLEPAATVRPRARRAPARATEVKPTRRHGATAPSTVPETLIDEGGPEAVPGLNEEDQIRAAKYLPREMPKRVFEEERFLFPETYGINRIRLLVRDPEWIFAYWDVSPEGMKELGRNLGERALALSRLTLRVVDPVSGASSDILLPPGARWWYVRTDSARRTYRAELGVTLPSGEFRRIAESNTVVTPRVGPSVESARRRISYPDAREIPVSAAEAASEAEKRTGVAREPWTPGAVNGAPEPTVGAAEKTGREDKGGASDAFRSGASDAFRR